jgi:uncharacterized protein YbbC (DUF1343 family)
VLALAAVLVAAAPIVQVGLERVAAERGGALRGKRIGLLVHAASVTADGRHAVEVLRASGVDVRRLFSPEHGLRSRAAAGEKLADGTDPESGLPVVSLYGTKTAPDRRDLADLDALVIDLQDAGVRFYTYAATMVRCLEAASDAGVELVVLDRPNPLGGARIAGPERQPGLPASLMSALPGPLLHGLTLGEMARLVNGRRSKPARLTVVPMSGWTRDMVWADTGRPFVPPSPNLRTAEAVLAYPGIALLEATNLSEGRGTEAPFLVFGAPFLKPEETAREVRAEGFRFEPASFTPVASPAATSPKHAGTRCRGLRVSITDAHAARPYAMGLALLDAVRRLHPEFRWLRDGAALDTLLGTRRVREALRRDESVETILAADAPALEAWERERRPALLY